MGLQAELDSKEPILLTVYAKWCGHSNMFMPTLDKVASLSDKKFRTVKIDLSEHRDASELIKHNIIGFPTLLAINNDKVEEYSGKRHENDIKEWMLSTCGAHTKASEKIDSKEPVKDNVDNIDTLEINEDQLKKVLEENDKPTLLLMYAPW